MKVGRMALVALGWLATVAVASTLTWTVISSAGLQVGRSVALPTTSASGTATPDATSWSGTGGRATASCSGERISLGSAVPDVGYSVEVVERGPRLLRLEFEPADDGEGRGSAVRAQCTNGSPVFSKD